MYCQCGRKENAQKNVHCAQISVHLWLCKKGFVNYFDDPKNNGGCLSLFFAGREPLNSGVSSSVHHLFRKNSLLLGIANPHISFWHDS
jgi:hypothetical protein